MYRRPLVPPPVGEPDIGLESLDEGGRGPDEVTFDVAGGSVTLLVPPDTPDEAVFDQDCPFIYCQLYLEDKVILEAWIPEDAPCLIVREQTADQSTGATGWGP